MQFDNKVVVRTDISTQRLASYTMWPNGWMDENTTWYGSIDLRAHHIVLDGFPALREWGIAPPPPFRPMSIVATVAHVSYC